MICNLSCFINIIHTYATYQLFPLRSQKLDIMQRSKEIPEQIRMKVIEIYSLERVNYTTSKDLGLQRDVIHTWWKHGSFPLGQPTKITQPLW